MAVKTWQPIKIRYCNHAGCEVALEVSAVYPAEHLPDQLPRITAHRCSRAIECTLYEKAACVWAGTNPTYDPFKEKDEEKGVRSDVDHAAKCAWGEGIS